MIETWTSVNIEENDVCQGTTRLWIVDVLNAPLHPTDQKNYLFRGKALTKVNVCGVVTECFQKGTKTNFTVDDSTGSIQCTLNHNRLISKNNQTVILEGTLQKFKTSDADDELIEALSAILSVTKQRSPFQGDFKIGDYVRVCGFMTDFFGYRSLNAFEVSKPLSERQAIYAMCQMAVLYLNVYNKKQDKKE